MSIIFYNEAMITPRSEFIRGVRNELSILLGVVPFGMIYGVAAIGAGIPPVIALTMSSIVFAGSSQFVITQLVAASVPGLIIVLTSFILNIRHMLYSASLAPYMRRLHPVWKVLLAYLLTDEAYAVTISHYQQPGEERYRHWHFLGAGLALWATWQISTAVGVLLGAQIPASWSLDFASTLTFIALVVPALKDRAGVTAALTAALVALLAFTLPLKLGIAVAAVAGIAGGLAIERVVKKPASTA